MDSINTFLPTLPPIVTLCSEEIALPVEISALDHELSRVRATRVQYQQQMAILSKSPERGVVDTYRRYKMMDTTLERQEKLLIKKTAKEKEERTQLSKMLIITCPEDHQTPEQVSKSILLLLCHTLFQNHPLAIKCNAKITAFKEHSPKGKVRPVRKALRAARKLSTSITSAHSQALQRVICPGIKEKQELRNFTRILNGAVLHVVLSTYPTLYASCTAAYAPRDEEYAEQLLGGRAYLLANGADLTAELLGLRGGDTLDRLGGRDGTGRGPFLSGTAAYLDSIDLLGDNLTLLQQSIAGVEQQLLSECRVLGLQDPLPMVVLLALAMIQVPSLASPFSLIAWIRDTSLSTELEAVKASLDLFEKAANLIITVIF
eukprot:gnl/Dysnectes_brevis/2334_a2750_1185.p1 GENE.gnl/Dysnectes_brevis/2334_a2750_1185~~gnl/Dysnectes_brevis/2334_a2750_1185.p1  ORF type:complete len:385 (-),score=51.85 gnl/Dysnectes_brevis/2334_a2750_1185:383-1507(-)